MKIFVSVILIAFSTFASLAVRGAEPGKQKGIYLLIAITSWTITTIVANIWIMR
jgi:hypothetical protein